MLFFNRGMKLYAGLPQKFIRSFSSTISRTSAGVAFRLPRRFFRAIFRVPSKNQSGIFPGNSPEVLNILRNSFQDFSRSFFLICVLLRFFLYYTWSSFCDPSSSFTLDFFQDSSITSFRDCFWNLFRGSFKNCF